MNQDFHIRPFSLGCNRHRWNAAAPHKSIKKSTGTKSRKGVRAGLPSASRPIREIPIPARRTVPSIRTSRSTARRSLTHEVQCIEQDLPNCLQHHHRSLSTDGSSVSTQANAYADDRFKSAINEVDSLHTDVDARFQVQDERIDRLGAMSTAMASMTSSMSGVSRINRVGVGAGESNGRLAMAVGYQRAFRDNGATLTAGASFTDEDSTVGVGAGFGW